MCVCCTISARILSVSNNDSIKYDLCEFSLQTDVANFLKSLKLAEYTHLFRREGYRTLDDVENLIGLTESHLKQMGITKKGKHSNLCAEAQLVLRIHIYVYKKMIAP